MFHLTGVYQDIIGDDPTRYLEECNVYWEQLGIAVKCMAATPVTQIRRRLSDGILLMLRGLPSQIALAEESLREIG